HTSLRNAYYKAPTVRMMGPGRDLTALHKDGREFPVEIGLSTFDDSAQQKRVLVSLVDITERKKMEMEMREINTNLEEFTYVVSHDLRSPLRGISDLIQWIEEDIGPDPPPEVTHNIDRITIRVDRMESLIDNLLAYARAGSACRDLKRIDMTELLQEVCEFVQIPEQFEVEVHVEPGMMISARTPLETVLRNLISNAIKHHDQASGKLVVTSVMEHNMCRIAVRDNGPGIPGNMHDRIFRLFQTVTASERQGTGIGLSVSRRLVETHGGRISVQANTPDRGSTFSVWWPRFVRKDTYD
ncbi:MAG TPA: PAS domain-containing sensor histidine kinase, partial [Gammaproteobacteria bacterium]|nr:PAS domain-containing sensor histidine kinase [Gammaproteobacteria bacterium]